MTYRKILEIQVAILLESSEILRRMELPTAPNPSRDLPEASGKRSVITEPNFDRPSRPISEFVARPDFPQCSHGEFVDIGGYTGVIIEITSQSIRVTSPESTTRSFNFHVLRRLYSPRPEPEADEMSRMSQPLVPFERKEKPPEAPSKKEVITEPNFDRSPKPITELANRFNFPDCAYGELVEIAGYTGVVIEIANQSLSVKSPQGIIRSYGVSSLRKLYGQR